jgi:hypothetical protein
VITLADNTLASWAPFLFELKGKVWEVFPTEAPFLAEMSGVGDSNRVGRFTRDMDGNRGIFSGKQVRHTIVLSQLAGGGYVQEASTWNVPHSLSSDEVVINLTRALVPFSVTVDVERDSFDNSNATAVAQLVKEARVALARLDDLWHHGQLRHPAPRHGLGHPHSLDGCRSRPGAQAQDRVGQRVHACHHLGHRPAGFGRWLGQHRPHERGWHLHPRLVVERHGRHRHRTGLPRLAGTRAGSGTFETIDKAAVVQWQGTDGRGGDTTSLPLSMQMLDGAVRRGRRAGIGVWDFAIGDPAAIDLYKQGLYAQARYDIADMTLKSGFSGVMYDGADKPFPLLKDPVAKKNALRLIEKDSFQLYGDQPGPSFLEDDGSMFRRFSRNLSKEAELLDRVQLGVTKCNTIVFLNNLAAAS